LREAHVLSGITRRIQSYHPAATNILKFPLLILAGTPPSKLFHIVSDDEKITFGELPPILMTEKPGSAVLTDGGLFRESSVRRRVRRGGVAVTNGVAPINRRRQFAGSAGADYVIEVFP